MEQCRCFVPFIDVVFALLNFRTTKGTLRRQDQLQVRKKNDHQK